MRLINTRTGNVYAYSKVLANDPEFVIYDEKPATPAEPTVEDVVTAKVVKAKKPTKKRATKNGDIPRTNQ